MFCQFMTSYAGKCNMYIKEGDRCKRHKGLTEKPKKEKMPRFRGDSKFQKDNGFFNGKNE